MTFARETDGVIVGSALLRQLESDPSPGGTRVWTAALPPCARYDLILQQQRSPNLRDPPVLVSLRGIAYFTAYFQIPPSQTLQAGPMSSFPRSLRSALEQIRATLRLPSVGRLDRW